MQSQRWMFMSPGGENEYKRPSVTREHYSAVIQEILRNKSAETDNERKRREFESATWKKMTECVLNKQIQEQKQRIDEMRPRSSTYGETYVKQGFKVKELGSEIDVKLQEKYPLYTDMANTIYLREYHKIKAKDSVHKPYSVIFRKDNRFTSRLSNPLDMHNTVKPNHYAYV